MKNEISHRYICVCVFVCACACVCVCYRIAPPYILTVSTHPPPLKRLADGFRFCVFVCVCVCVCTGPMVGSRMMECTYRVHSFFLFPDESAWMHVLISIPPVGCVSTDPKKCVSTGPVGCMNTMVSQHRSGRMWKHHNYFDEKNLEKSILTKQHLWTSKLQPIIC